jgi:hypothetical protein
MSNFPDTAQWKNVAATTMLNEKHDSTSVLPAKATKLKPLLNNSNNPAIPMPSLKISAV